MCAVSGRRIAEASCHVAKPKAVSWTKPSTGNVEGAVCQIDRLWQWFLRQQTLLFSHCNNLRFRRGKPALLQGTSFSCMESAQVMHQRISCCFWSARSWQLSHAYQMLALLAASVIEIKACPWDTCLSDDLEKGICKAKSLMKLGCQVGDKCGSM
jgi:hypothetical protein